MKPENRTAPPPLPTVITSLVLHHILRFAFDTMSANSRVLGEWPQRLGADTQLQGGDAMKPWWGSLKKG